MSMFKSVLSSWKRTLTLGFILSNGFGLYYHLHPTAPNSEISGNLIGDWRVDYQYGYGELSERVIGITSYFANGKYNFSGDLIIKGGRAGNIVEVTYHSDAAGTWVRYDNKIITSLDNMKSFPTMVQLNGKEMPKEIIEKSDGMKKYYPEDIRATGKNQQYQVVEERTNSITLRTINPYGMDFDSVIKRVK
ncbi:hypothetical protein [Erwinia sp. S59]|uniref:hypothetical protein n=1 Tax=Erwinia sp. S59 TaxID=2769340 RepID=UPI00190A60ED|nr:hypothetical protein [Erwinia sp. S59]MBK0093437.1 hypothetical protein [Erwinia sp. S59]